MINDELLKIVGISSAGIFFLLSMLFLFRGNFHKKKHSHDAEQKIQESQHTPEKSAIKQETPHPSATDSVSWIIKLTRGLQKTRSHFISALNEFFLSTNDKKTRDDILEKLFEILIRCDVGVETAELLVLNVKNQIQENEITNYDAFLSILKKEILKLFSDVSLNSKGILEEPKAHPHVILLVGVNGVGKTTTTGKLANKASQNNKKVMIGAADTFRAAAVEQLSIWAERAHAELIQLKQNNDPASVAFEAVKRAVQENFDICLIDTAGRLQTRQDLMQELSKISRVIDKNMIGAPHEVLLVLDASMGQNAIEQAKLFQSAVHVTGIVLTKLDGTAKGGVVLAIASKLKLPIRYIGIGENLEDLQPFHAEDYITALFA